MTTLDTTTGSDEIDALKAALAAERAARLDAEARASGAEALVAQLKLMIARLKRDRFGASSERGRKLLDQLELQLEELEAAATEDAANPARSPRRRAGAMGGGSMSSSVMNAASACCRKRSAWRSARH